MTILRRTYKRSAGSIIRIEGIQHRLRDDTETYCGIVPEGHTSGIYCLGVCRTCEDN